jgi:hypothetical protein
MNKKPTRKSRFIIGSKITRAIALLGVIIFIALPHVQAQSVQAANASFVWGTEMGGASGNIPDLCIDAKGNCFAICHFNSTNAIVGGTILTNANPGTYDSFLVKYNSRGQPQWLQHFSGNASDFGLAVAVDSTGAAYVVGNFFSTTMTVGGLSVNNSTGTNNSDIFFAKFDSNGVPQFLRRFGGSGIDTAFHVAVDHNDDVLVTGSFFSSTMTFDSFTLPHSGDSDIFLAKFNSAGQTLWADQAGGTGADSAYRMVIDSANNCYLTGYYHGPATFGTATLNSAGGSFDVYITKYDSSGNVQWAVGGGGSGTDEGFAIAQDAAGNSFVTGYFASASASFGGQVIHTAGGNDIFTVKISPAGTFLWARSAGGTGDDRGKAIAVDAQGNAYVSGYFSGTATFGNITLTSTGATDLCIIKYDPNGNVQWVIPATGPTSDTANAITRDAHGHFYISGSCSTNTVFGGLTLTNALINAMFVARLDFLPPPVNITISNAGPCITWSTNYLTPVAPQASTDLLNWQDLTNSPTPQNGVYSLTNLPTGSPSFYRLRNVD